MGIVRTSECDSDSDTRKQGNKEIGDWVNMLLMLCSDGEKKVVLKAA